MGQAPGVVKNRPLRTRKAPTITKKNVHNVTEGCNANCPFSTVTTDATSKAPRRQPFTKASPGAAGNVKIRKNKKYPSDIHIMLCTRYDAQSFWQTVADQELQLPHPRAGNSVEMALFSYVLPDAIGFGFAAHVYHHATVGVDPRNCISFNGISLPSGREIDAVEQRRDM